MKLPAGNLNHINTAAHQITGSRQLFNNMIALNRGHQSEVSFGVW